MDLSTQIRCRVAALLAKIFTLRTLTDSVQFKRTRRPLRFNGEDLPYLFHSYNNLGMTERSAEIPIIRHYVTRQRWQRILEIGNVTNYYEDYFAGLFPNKTVVDKCERNHNIITSDIAAYSAPVPFDFIFSVSTFEHMDSDLERNPDYRPGAARHGTVAADNISHCYQTLLAPGGTMVVTAPLGYTPEWDDTFKTDLLEGCGFRHLRRLLVSRITEQEWRQVEGFDARAKYHYDSPYPYANHISIVEISK